MRIDSRRALAITITCVFGWLFTYYGANNLGNYGFGIFLLLPLVLGFIPTVIQGYKNRVTQKQVRNTALLTIAVFMIGLIVFAIEGGICLVMAFPLSFLLAWLGQILAWQAIVSNLHNSTPVASVFLLMAVPLVITFEESGVQKENLRSVVTSIEINASPETVWKNVVVFPQLPEPTELIFKTGIAYPTNATIKGTGVGAIRHCNFTTGTFVEPITVWNEPTLLSFDVKDQPEPMKELSPYDIHPNHLHGYWVSKKGQFKLTKLPNGHTLLEGTTWYVNRIKPGFYWTLWSDYIVHAIHERVLQHIKVESEQAS